MMIGLQEGLLVDQLYTGIANRQFNVILQSRWIGFVGNMKSQYCAAGSSHGDFVFVALENFRNDFAFYLKMLKLVLEVAWGIDGGFRSE